MSVSSSSVAIWHAAGIAGKALGCGMQLGSSNLPQLASQLLPKVGNVIVADRFQGPRRQMGSSRVAACPSHYAEHAGESACLSSPSKHEQNYGNVSSSNVNRDMQHPTCEVPGQAASHPVPSVALGSVAGKLTAVRDLQLRYIHSGTAAAANRHWLPFSTGTHLCHISRTSLPADSASASSPRLSPCRGQQTIQHHFSRNLPGSAASNQSSLNAAWYHPLFNAANAVSMARLASGPFIAAWLLEGHTQFAVVALALSGASDWLDGWLARRYDPHGVGSAVGSYLDPLADKVLIGCVAAALLAKGTMPLWLAGVVVGRDVVLVAGSFLHRFHAFGWHWPGASAFFRTASSPLPLSERTHTRYGATAPVADVLSMPSPSSSGTVSAMHASPSASNAKPVASPVSSAKVQGAVGAGSTNTDCSTSNASSPAVSDEGVPAMTAMRPLLISKANTVLQIGLLASYLSQELVGLPAAAALHTLEYATAATTLASGFAYAHLYISGRLLK